MGLLTGLPRQLHRLPQNHERFVALNGDKFDLLEPFDMGVGEHHAGAAREAGERVIGLAEDRRQLCWL